MGEWKWRKWCGKSTKSHFFWGASLYYIIKSYMKFIQSYIVDACFTSLLSFLRSIGFIQKLLQTSTWRFLVFWKFLTLVRNEAHEGLHACDCGYPKLEGDCCDTGCEMIIMHWPCLFNIQNYGYSQPTRFINLWFSLTKGGMFWGNREPTGG